MANPLLVSKSCHGMKPHFGVRHAIRVRRAPAKSPPVDIGFALQLMFEQPVHGPILLGYGAHFGLGRFAAKRLFLMTEGEEADRSL